MQHRDNFAEKDNSFNLELDWLLHREICLRGYFHDIAFTKFEKDVVTDTLELRLLKHDHIVQEDCKLYLAEEFRVDLGQLGYKIELSKHHDWSNGFKLKES